MRNLVLIVHISLDGFVAGPAGELKDFPSAEENLAFVAKLTETADSCLVGRKSYELLNAYWPTARNHPGATAPEKAYSNWYNDAQKIVVSCTLQNTIDPKTKVVSTDPGRSVFDLKHGVGKDILIFGSPSVAHELMTHGLIDVYWIFVNPLLLGRGIPLFRESSYFANLKLTETKLFQNGEVALKYSTGM